MDKSPNFPAALSHLLSRQFWALRSLIKLGKVLLLLVATAIPALAADRISVEQLEQTLAAARGQRDSEIAQQLSKLELTERLSLAGLARAESEAPGPQSRRSLVVLSDVSAFLDPPAAEIPDLAKPDPAAQRTMIALTVDYVKKTIHQLPNLFARRVTSSFQGDLWLKKPLHPAGKYSAVVLYRDGDESLQSSGSKSGAPGLTTSGEFGPILGTALLDAAQGNLIWSHWEQGAAGPEAVYRYSVNAEKSHYEVENQFSGYEGEIAIDPSNGAVLRLVLRAYPEPTNPFLTARIVVEYGPVEIGGKTYICPLKGIALSQGLELIWLNVVHFQQYHLFRGSARILPGFRKVP